MAHSLTPALSKPLDDLVLSMKKTWPGQTWSLSYHHSCLQVELFKRLLRKGLKTKPVLAILNWLALNKNLKYSDRTGVM